MSVILDQGVCALMRQGHGEKQSHVPDISFSESYLWSLNNLELNLTEFEAQSAQRRNVSRLEI